MEAALISAQECTGFLLIPVLGRASWREVDSKVGTMIKEESETVRTFKVEGQAVRCVELDGNHLWHCNCAAFEERLSRLGEGFCGHIVVAMSQGLQGEP